MLQTSKIHQAKELAADKCRIELWLWLAAKLRIEAKSYAGGILWRLRANPAVYWAAIARRLRRTARFSTYPQHRVPVEPQTANCSVVASLESASCPILASSVLIATVCKYKTKMKNPLCAPD